MSLFGGLIAGAGLGMIGSLFGQKQANKAANRAKNDFYEMRNNLITGEGGFNQQLSALQGNADNALARDMLYNRAITAARSQSDLLKRSALASTLPGQVAALEAARAAGASRGGLAFGGGVGAIAGQAARSVAPMQGAALAQALAQSNQALMGAYGAAANLGTSLSGQELALRQQALMGISSLAGGAQQAAGAARANPQNPFAGLGGLGSFMSGAAAMGGSGA